MCAMHEEQLSIVLNKDEDEREVEVSNLEGGESKL